MAKLRVADAVSIARNSCVLISTAPALTKGPKTQKQKSDILMA